jgi:hypothetical protein
MAAPASWTVDQSSQLTFIPNDEAATRTLLLGRQKGMDVLLDFKTGKVVYVGRTTISKGLTLNEPES